MSGVLDVNVFFVGKMVGSDNEFNELMFRSVTF